jgi:hypothetical protein
LKPPSPSSAKSRAGGVMSAMRQLRLCVERCVQWFGTGKKKKERAPAICSFDHLKVFFANYVRQNLWNSFCFSGFLSVSDKKH